jgi:hypothetical protein
MKKNTLILLVLSFSFWACLDPVDLDKKLPVERLIVEGGISNIAAESTLRLSYTDAVGAPKRILPSAGVYAEIRVGNGQKIPLKADQKGSGLFSPLTSELVGGPGQTYSLFVKLANGKEYLSRPQKMPEIVPVGTLQSEALQGDKIGYAISTDLADPKDQANFYRFKAEAFSIRKSVGIRVGFGDNFCCNICWVKDQDETINILSDKSFNGNTIKNKQVFFSKYYGGIATQVKVSQYNITKEAFNFYTTLKTQLNRTGSIFDPLPAGVRGNMVNTQDPDDLCLGFFEVASINTKKLFIQDNKLEKYNAFYSTPIYVPDGDCMLRYPLSVYFESVNQNLF